LGNAGDLAMLRVATDRLRRLWPGAAISIVTDAPAALQRQFPAARPIPLSGQITFESDRLFGRAERSLPPRLRRAAVRAQQHLRRQHPQLLATVIAGKHALTRRAESGACRDYVDAVRAADLVLASGAGIFTDAFLDNALGVMATLELAADAGIPTAIMGHGFGPVEGDLLRRRMAHVLPRIDLITVRERRRSVDLLLSLGVRRERLRVTGDDAIELAHRSAVADAGRGIGVNVRIASFAGLSESMIDPIRRVVGAAATAFDAPLVPLPISYHRDRSDMAAIRQITGEPSATGTALDLDPDDPLGVIAHLPRCRLVVTGSYHGAVFALAQGIPAVTLAASEYYRFKFMGIADLFGDGCAVVDLHAHDAAAVLEREIARAWSRSLEWRERLLDAAGNQIARSLQAYAMLERVVPRRCTSDASLDSSILCDTRTGRGGIATGGRS
jgi:colanic acid/amylovoran biosynthesis protein